MRAALGKTRPDSPQIKRTGVQSDEQMFVSVIGDVARLLWPTKTAAHIAAAAGCTERAAEFYLSGDREWSGAAIAAIVGEVLKRHSFKNFKVIG